MSAVSLIIDDRYLEHDAGDGHPESPERLAVIHDLIERDFRSLPRIQPRIATHDELALVHDPAYIELVSRTVGRPHTQLDADTGLCAKSYETARLAAGGLLQAVDSLLASSAPLSPLSSVFAFVRPPGHHAEPSHAMGFCIFNNAAIAAAYARQRHGLKRVLIVDWDLHHGNGTQHAFYDDPQVLFFSSHQYPYYPGTGGLGEVGSGAGEGFTVNAPLPPGFGDSDFHALYTGILAPIAREFQPELIIVSAGFDPYHRDPLGGLKLTGDGFGGLAAIVKDIATETCGKLLLTLEGGYHPNGLREGVGAVLTSLLGTRQPLPGSEPSETAKKVIARIVSVQHKYWKGLRPS